MIVQVFVRSPLASPTKAAVTGSNPGGFVQEMPTDKGGSNT